MSEPTPAPIRYEQPVIVRRDSIAGLADAGTQSDVVPPTTQGTLPPDPSDVNVKENIRPVRW